MKNVTQTATLIFINKWMFYEFCKTPNFKRYEQFYTTVPKSSKFSVIASVMLLQGSGTAEGYTMPSNYASARPDLQFKIHHW
jgi:hypothetical protein